MWSKSLAIKNLRRVPSNIPWPALAQFLRAPLDQLDNPATSHPAALFNLFDALRQYQPVDKGRQVFFLSPPDKSSPIEVGSSPPPQHDTSQTMNHMPSSSQISPVSSPNTPPKVVSSIEKAPEHTKPAANHANLASSPNKPSPIEAASALASRTMDRAPSSSQNPLASSPKLPLRVVSGIEKVPEHAKPAAACDDLMFAHPARENTSAGTSSVFLDEDNSTTTIPPLAPTQQASSTPAQSDVPLATVDQVSILGSRKRVADMIVDGDKAPTSHKKKKKT